MSDYEPPAESVEVLAKELHEAYRRSTGCEAFECSGNGWRVAMREQARFVLRRQHEREAEAKLALRYLTELGGGNSEGNIYARRALERWEKLDAPKVPSLLEAAKALTTGCYCNQSAFSVNGEQFSALKAAVEREEKR